jgi:hypothetical protein
MEIKWGTKVYLGERTMNGERAVQVCASAGYGEAGGRIPVHQREKLKDREDKCHDLIAATIPIADLVRDFRGGYRERWRQAEIFEAAV